MPIDLQQLLPKEKLTNREPFAVCFTGPRATKLYGYNDRTPYNEIVQTMVPILRELADAGCTKFISGGAQGIDQLAFWSVKHVQKTHPNVQNVLYLPFQNQPDRWAQQGLFSKQEYQMMLQRADSITYISDRNPTGGYDAGKMLTERNHAMVRDADLVFAFLHGESLNWQNSRGGTSECIRYATSNQVNVLGLRYKEGPQQITTLQNILAAPQPAPKIQISPQFGNTFAKARDTSDMQLKPGPDGVQNTREPV